MTDFEWIILVMCLIFGGPAIVGIFDRMADLQAAKAGLQQCVVENRTIWQKECK